MTAPAGHQAVQIMSNLFVMISEMTLPAVAVNVLAVARLRCQRMAGQAGDLCVRRLPKLSRVDKRNFLSGQSLSRLAFLSVAVKADSPDLLRCPAFLRQDQTVAGHARFILG
jgi:type IV secretory pathway VirB3-like protein